MTDDNNEYEEMERLQKLGEIYKSLTPNQQADMMDAISVKKEGVHRCHRCGQMDERPTLIGATYLCGKSYLNLLICRDCSTLQRTDSNRFFNEGWDYLPKPEESK